MANDLGLNGIEFVEFASPYGEFMDRLFTDMGFTKTMTHSTKTIDLYEQNDIHFLLNHTPRSFAEKFSETHGPSVPSMGWRVKNPEHAFKVAVERGARPCSEGDYPLKALYGIGDSVIYLPQENQGQELYESMGFKKIQNVKPVKNKGFMYIDHLTNNVHNGTMEKWAQFYKGIFGFEEIRYFDIRGSKTGLQSYALKSPCGKFSIPINEAKEQKSQINEYLDEYKGPGVQHIALLTKDLLTSLTDFQGTSVKTLEIEPSYYEEAFQRVPHVKEDKNTIQQYQVLLDGDEEGYLLQIFSKNLIGPIFFEFIQRNNHHSFGEGNFQALFKSIERDQIKRGYL